MMRIPEVEIVLPFRDPAHRIEAMHKIRDMMQFRCSLPGRTYVHSARLVYTNVKNGVIVLKFSFGSREVATIFNNAYEARTKAEQDTYQW